MRRARPYCLGAALLLLAAGGTALAQSRVDSTAAMAAGDSARARTDSAAQAVSPSGVDTTIVYTAEDSVVYSIGARTMSLYGKGDVRYRELGLKAGVIDVNWNTSTLRAYSVADTADSAGKRPAGAPVLIDGNETYNGSVITYNFKSKRGRIDLARTEIERALYAGQTIEKTGENVLYVREGRFTTCDLDHPHYAFGSPEMKVFVGDKIVARPIYFYVADVPVFIVPFGVFPSQKGRRSGIIIPGYGESTRGRYLTHLGYYWATNDYMDVNVRADLYTNGSYTIYSDFRYALRYNFVGTLSASIGRSITGEPADPDYADSRVFNVHVTHNQDFNPSTRLVVDFMFTSASYFQNTSYMLDDLLRQNVVSNATLTKFWEGTPNSLTLNVRRDQNLNAQEGEVELSELLPSVIFNMNQTFPFRSSRSAGVGGAGRWYDLIGLSYNGQMVNRRTTTIVGGSGVAESRPGVQHQLLVNASPRAGHFTVTPFVNYTEKWYGHRTLQEFNPADSTLSQERESGFRAVRYFDMGLSLGTKLYGILQMGTTGITAFRHQILPSLSLVYAPDFSTPGWGYYGNVETASGQQVRYDYYAQEAFGGAPAGKRQAINFSLGNVFEMKTVSSDSAAREDKFQLLILNLGLGYNFAADSLRLSELGMDFRTSIGQILSIGGSGRFNFYAYEPFAANPQLGRRVDQFLLSKEGRLADLTSFNISIGTRLSGQKVSTTSGPARVVQDTAGLRKQTSGMYNLYTELEPDFSIPWNLDLMWSYSINQQNPQAIFRSSTIMASLGFNLTEAWKFNASTGYDMLNRQVTAPQITIYRDLHCWEMNFSWVPVGQYRNFRVEIRLKAPQLQDLKLSKQGSVRGIY